MAWHRFLLTRIALLCSAPPTQRGRMHVARTFLLTLVLIGAGHAGAAPRQTAPRPVPVKQMSEQEVIAKLKQRPLVMFVARGEPNACGPGCSAWIAVEGTIDKHDERPLFELGDHLLLGHL